MGLTKNYDNFISLIQMPAINRHTDGTVIYEGTDFALKKPDGTLATKFTVPSGSSYGKYLTMPFAQMVSMDNPTSVSYGATCIAIGSNNKDPENYDNYKLITPLVLSASNTTSADLCRFAVTTEDITNSSGSIERKFTYVFVANRPCTVGEYGFYYGTPGVLSPSPAVLVFRRVYENAISLETNDTLKIEFTVTVPTHTHQYAG